MRSNLQAAFEHDAQAMLRTLEAKDMRSPQPQRIARNGMDVPGVLDWSCMARMTRTRPTLYASNRDVFLFPSRPDA